MPPLSSNSNVTTSESISESSKKILMSSSTLLDEEVRDDCDLVAEDMSGSEKEAPFHVKIVWKNVILFAYLHMAALYGAYLMFVSAMWQTNAFTFAVYMFSGVGVTGGAHRLWAHRAYKAKLPLRIFLAFWFTIASENDIYVWARDHRVHHKYSETNADPHNAKRGFFFAHMGWLLCRKHPEVTRKGKAVDTSDLLADPVVRFHRKYYIPLVLLCSFVLPTIIPMYVWGETFSNAFFVATLFRLVFLFHMTWFVNSAAHMWGHRPYDVTINPRQSAIVILAGSGEGFHNYHHTFPYDYAASEYGIKYNMTTGFIDVMAFFGLAYDRKTASRRVIAARKLRTGGESLIKENSTSEVKMNATDTSEAIQSKLVQIATEAVQNSILEASKIVTNRIDNIPHLSKVVQDDVLQLSKVAPDGASNILQPSNVVQEDVSDILMTSLDNQHDVLDVPQTCNVPRSGVYKRMTQNGVQQAAAAR